MLWTSHWGVNSAGNTERRSFRGSSPTSSHAARRSGTAARLGQTAAHLVDHVIPPVPVRQWVISVPKRLRCSLLLIGGLAHREQSFRVEGAGGGLAALIVLAVVTLVLPYVTITTSVGTYSRAQSLFAAFVSAALWGIFVFVQTVRHRDYFLPHDDHALPDEHAAPPSRRQATLSFVLHLVSLVALVGLAKVLSHPLEEFVEAFDLPRGVVGIAVALVVLLPETWAAIRAAHANRLQSSMNLAIGSALATVITMIAWAVAMQPALHPRDLVAGPRRAGREGRCLLVADDLFRRRIPGDRPAEPRGDRREVAGVHGHHVAKHV